MRESNTLKIYRYLDEAMDVTFINIPCTLALTIGSVFLFA